MKATGIVRRIDELGRVVVPKEIRRTLRIREGDPLEIFTNRDGEVILKKYSPIGELDNFAKKYDSSAQVKILEFLSDLQKIIMFESEIEDYSDLNENWNLVLRNTFTRCV